MSENRKRTIQGRTRPQNDQNQRQGIRNNLPRSNIANSVTRSQNRIRNIKSPFATDQTKTIANKPKQTKKRSVGQIPLRDRQHSKIKVNQQAGSGIGSQVRKLAQKKQRSGLGQQVRKLAQQKTNRPKAKQFTKKNKTRKEVEQVFDFNSNRSFF